MISIHRVLVASVFLAASACVAQTRGPETPETPETLDGAAAPQIEGLLAKGRFFARHGDLTRASQYFTSAIDAGAPEGLVLVELMRVYVRGGRLRLALETGERNLTREPENYPLRLLVGTLYSALGEGLPAKWHLERVLVSEPKLADAHYALAVVLRDSLRDFAGADRHFRLYLQLEPRGDHVAEATGSLLKSVP